MNVIHYMFGLPPLRKGGLPKYALSLIEAQKQMGYHITILVPGPFDKSGRTSVREWKQYKGIPCYRILNGLPVGNEYGIRETDAFTGPIPEEVFEKWQTVRNGRTQSQRAKALTEPCRRSRQYFAPRTVKGERKWQRK